MKKGFYLLLLLLGPSMAMGAEEVLYILSAKANLLSEPSFKSTIISSMTRGEKVFELDKNNNWFKVRYNDKEGWLSRLAVSPNPPMKRVTLLAENDTQLAGEARRRASVNTNTASVRGLRANADRSRASDTDAVDYGALKLVEQFSVNENEVADFMAALR